MNRITRRIANSIDFVDGKGYANLSHQEGVRMLFDRLAAYEDAEEQGRLMKLPCKVGDTVYIIHIGEIYKVKVEAIHCWAIECWKVALRTIPPDKYTGFEVRIDQFGQTVFLTREAAKEALKGREEK